MATTKFLTARVAPESVTTKLLVIGAFDSEFPAGIAAELNSRCGGLLAAQAVEEEFKGAKGTTMVAFTNNAVGARRVLVYGLGSRDKFNLAVLRDALTAAFKRAKALKVDEVTVAAFDLEGTSVSAVEFGEAVGTYAGLIAYNMNHFKTAKGGHKGDPELKQVRVLTGTNDAAAIKQGVTAGSIIASAQNNVRNLVNLPASTCDAQYLAAHARELPQRTKGKVSVRVLNKRECEKLGMNAFLAVNRGSQVPPALIVTEYSPANAVPGVVLGLVGKSITFDTGGLDLKTAEGMRTMKCDMAGGATVLSAIAAIAALELPIKVIAVTAATDNMPGRTAFKPGDVIVSMNGKTIEVDNTDAEGRVTLADAIEYTKQLGATHLVDLATLTGAVITTCADVGAGLFGLDQAWIGEVQAAANAAGEYVWPMPMWAELRDANKTPMADLKNSGASFGGAGSSSAALFLAEFAESTPWVHLDIAGTAYRKRHFQADPDGGTGWGLRTVVALARRLAAKAS